MEVKMPSHMIPDKLYFSRKEIAEMLNVSERKIINITTKHKIRPRMQVYANNCGGRKNLYSLSAIEKIKRIIEKRKGGGA